MADLFDEFGIGSEQGKAPDLFDEFDLGDAPKPAAEGITDTLWEGTKSAGRAIGATVDAYTGDNQGIVDKAAAQQAAPKDARVEKFQQDFAQRTEALGEDPGVLDTIGEGFGAVVDNPAGAGLSIVEQVPNAVPTLAGGWAGMKAGGAGGALVGSAVPVVGTAAGAAIGGVVGGLAGMFLGNAAIETGHKAMGLADDGMVTDEERGQAIEEGATKGAVITGVDALTLGVGGKVAGAMQRTTSRALESAPRKALVDRGIDVADEAAVLAARSNPEIAGAVRAAQESARSATDRLGKRLATGGTLLTMETVGEGVGEYLGEMAATGEGNVPDAVLESLLSLGQSGAETAWNVSRTKARPDAMVQPTPSAENPNPAPVERPDPSAGPLSAAANLLPAPSIAGALPAPDTLYADAAGNVNATGPNINVDGTTQPAQQGQAWVNPQNNPAASGGAGMDQQAARGADAPLQGALIRGAGKARDQTEQRQPVTIDGQVEPAPQGQIGSRPVVRLLADQRQSGFVADSQGNVQTGKIPNQPPADYVQGGRGMDQQAPIGKRYGNVLAAKNAIQKAGASSTLEAVQVGDKDFEIQAKVETKPVLQNRDRSTPASITQMREIAARPDYSRLGFSRDFANGAPVVEPGALVPKARLGRQDVATTASGRQIPVQYAAVEAAALLPSHDVNGTPSEHYASGVRAKSRAIAGNGRIAGLRHAFTQRTAGGYVEQLAADDLHGIAPAAIRSMKEPVLVRIMPLDEITQDIGDESNTVGVSALSGAEQATNDARRIDIDALEFSESGEISDATVRQFVQAMPKAEQGGMLDGMRPSRQAHDRAASAIFASAYESEALIRLQAQATDPEVRTVLSGLLVAAPKMAKLKGAGNWDIRGLVVEAAEAAVNARRNGQTLSEYAKQADLDRNPETQPIVELFAENIRSAKRIGESLSNLADLFYSEASKPDTDMFGDVPKRDRQELLGESNGTAEGESRSAQTTGEQAGPGTAAPGVEGRATERAEPAGPAADAQPEAFQLNTYSEDELAAQASAQAAADAAAAAQQKAVANKAQADRDRNDFTLSGSDRPADVAASRGQNDMFGTGAQRALESAAHESATSPRNDLPEPISKKAEAKTESTKPGQAKIEDFGEKIGGARKDLAVSTGTKPARASDGDTRPAWARRFDISQVVSSTNTAEIGRWEVRDNRTKDWMKQPKKVGTGSYATREEAEQAVPLIAVAQRHRAVPLRHGEGAGFEIWRDITDRKRVKVVDQVFPSREAALKYMASNAQQIIETNTTFGEADLPRPDNAQRIGAARREGPVKDRDFIETFGFRGVEFGNWNNQEERQQLLDDAYDGLLDLAEVMDIPPKAISLNGDLALAFGARGHGLSGARAHYEPPKAAINLTKMNGAGSLAHEWFHALDHYFGRQDGKALAEWVTDKDGTRSLKTSDSFEREAVSSGFSRTGSGVRAEVRQAYTELMKTMTYKAEQYVEDTARADNFVARARKEVADRLDRLRADLAEQKDPQYWKRHNKPASGEQLASFDTVAQQILDGVQLDTELRSTKPDAPVRRRNAFGGMRWTNDALEQFSVIYKAVRGRSGFNADNNGELDRLRGAMSGYSSRLKMLADAQGGAEKTKQVPTQFAMDAKELDQGRGTNYWTTPHEMAARAFQGYVEDMVAERGGKSPFLNYGPENFGIPTPWGWKRPFPAGEERKAINEAFTKLAQVIETRESENGNVALYRLSDDTRAAYEQRIDELFAGAEPNNTAGVRVLDRSDVLDMLGFGDHEVVLAEKHAVSDGRFNHPQFTAADWKKVPEWLENPVAVFERDDGHLTVIAPETKGGEPIIIGINPDARQAGYAGGKRLHVVLSAYNKDRGRLPIERMVRDGQLRYVDTRKSPAFNDSSGHRLPGNVVELRGLGKKVYSGADLFKYRSANSATDGPQLRLNAGKVKGLPLLSAKAIARQVQEASGLRAVVVDNEFALPGDVLEQVLRDGAVGRAAGLYYRGTAYLVASNLRDVKHAQEVLLHEVVGHQGVRAVLGARTGQVMQQIYAGMPAVERQELEARYANQLKNLGEQERQATVAQEYVAHLAETNPQHSVVQRLVALVRAFLRRVFGAKGALRWSHADIVALLADSRRLINRGEPVAEADLQPAGAVSYRQAPTEPAAAGLPQVEEVDEAEFVASLKDEGAVRSIARSLYRARGTDSPFFQRWFEGSRMVDKAGRPIAFVHRSFGEKVRFDDTRLGGSTGTATAALGHFLARQDVGNVERYGPVVEKFYIRMRKPKLITQAQFEAMGDWSLTQVKAYRKTLMEQGYDGLYVQGLAWPVVFEGKNIKAARNAGTFDESDQVRYSLTGEQVTTEALRKMGLAGSEAASAVEQIRAMTLDGLQGKAREWATRSEEGLFDGLAGIKRAEESVGVTDPNQQGYVSARMASGIADVMHGVLHYAAPEWRDGVVSGKAGTRGVLEILGDLGPDNLTPWLAWLGGKRGQLLKAQGRENNLSDTDIAELQAMGKGKEALFEKVYREYAQVNEAVLDLAQGAGLIDPDARAKWLTDYYVPFYRQDESEDVFTAPRSKRGLSHQTAAIKALKGGTLPTNDLLANMLAGWTKRIDASMKNKALLEVVDNLKGSDFLADESPRWQQVLISRDQIAAQIRNDRKALALAAQMLDLPAGANALQVVNKLMKPENEGFEQLWTRVAPTDPDIIRVQRDGKSEYYRVGDESLLRGLKFMEGSVFNDPITRIGRAFKRLLTTGVTASPDFILRNFIRDAAHAWLINKDGFTLGKDSIKGMRDALREDQDYRDLMFAGGSFQGGYVHGADPEASAQIIRRALEKKGFSREQQDQYLGSVVNTPAKAAAMLKQGWQKYRELGDKVENANRLSTYKAALSNGKSRRQAAFEAKDLMDYSLRGNFAAAQWFTDVVPFLNARLQGLYKLGRAVKGDKTLLAKEVAMKGGYIALFSLLLAGINDDDERYQALQDWDKDMHWHIFLGDEHYRIPKPFELGLVFGTVPERLLHSVTGSQDGGDLAKAVAQGVFQTLAFNPVPQFYQPIRELQANRNFFRDSPIEDMSDEGKLPEARYDERTSALGYGVGQVTGRLFGISPKQVDHLVQGYTGTLGGYVLGMSSLIAAGFAEGDRPELRATDLPVVKAVYQGDAVTTSKYQAEFYDMMREADQLQRTINAFKDEGRVEAAASLREENQAKLRHRPALGLVRKQLGNIRNQMDAIYRDENMGGGEKRKRLDELQRKSNQIAQRVSERAGGDF